MSATLQKLLDLFRDYSPEREARKKMTEAKLLLVDHECNREYYTASCAMLKERIARLEHEAAAPVDIQYRPTAKTASDTSRISTAFHFRRAGQ